MPNRTRARNLRRSSKSRVPPKRNSRPRLRKKPGDSRKSRPRRTMRRTLTRMRNPSKATTMMKRMSPSIETSLMRMRSKRNYYTT